MRLRKLACPSTLPTTLCAWSRFRETLLPRRAPRWGSKSGKRQWQKWALVTSQARHEVLDFAESSAIPFLFRVFLNTKLLDAISSHLMFFQNVTGKCRYVLLRPSSENQKKLQLCRKREKKKNRGWAHRNWAILFHGWDKRIKYNI